MVNAYSELVWFCGKCGEGHETEEEANACCAEEPKTEEEE